MQWLSAVGSQLICYSVLASALLNHSSVNSQLDPSCLVGLSGLSDLSADILTLNPADSFNIYRPENNRPSKSEGVKCEIVLQANDSDIVMTVIFANSTFRCKKQNSVIVSNKVCEEGCGRLSITKDGSEERLHYGFINSLRFIWYSQPKYGFNLHFAVSDKGHNLVNLPDGRMTAAIVLYHPVYMPNQPRCTTPEQSVIVRHNKNKPTTAAPQAMIIGTLSAIGGFIIFLLIRKVMKDRSARSNVIRLKDFQSLVGGEKNNLLAYKSDSSEESEEEDVLDITQSRTQLHTVPTLQPEDQYFEENEFEQRKAVIKEHVS